MKNLKVDPLKVEDQEKVGAAPETNTELVPEILPDVIPEVVPDVIPEVIPEVVPELDEKKENTGVVPDRETKISEHISYKEATGSETADELELDNTPTEEILEVMKVTAAKVFEPLRRFWKCPIFISSFYRSVEVNAVLVKDKKIRASKNSQHVNGEAMDIDAQVFGNISNRQVFEYLRDNCIFDQLVWEQGNDNEPEWVHVSYRAGANRMQVFRKRRVGRSLIYEDLTPYSLYRIL